MTNLVALVTTVGLHADNVHCVTADLFACR